MAFVNYTSRYHSIMTYAEIDELRPLLMSVKHYCYIEHNKDNNEPHKHLLVAYVHDKSANALLKELKGLSLQNSFVEPIKKGSAMLDYLIHAKQPEKFQYSDSDIVYDSREYWQEIFIDEYERTKALAEAKKQDDEAKALAEREFIDDIIDGRLSHRELAYKYGRDYVRNCRSYIEFRYLVRQEEEEAEAQAQKAELEEALQGSQTQYIMNMSTADELYFINNYYLKGLTTDMKINATIVGKTAIGEHTLYQATTDYFKGKTEGLSCLTFYGSSYAHLIGDTVELTAFKGKKDGKWVYLDKPDKSIKEGE